MVAKKLYRNTLKPNGFSFHLEESNTEAISLVVRVILKEAVKTGMFRSRKKIVCQKLVVVVI